MPVERISQSFKDLSLTFKPNPLNQDLIVLKNETAIARSLRNLVMTFTGERFFNPEIGSRVSRLLFENMSEVVSDLIRDEIRSTIINYEPRVDLDDVIVSPNYDNNEYNITIRYTIIGIDALQQQLSFVLLATR